MGAIVRNVYHRDGRWKFRKAIPAKLRPHIDGQPREFIRSLGRGGKHPPPDVLTGHKMKGVAFQYGETELEAMELVINRLPKYEATMTNS